MPASCYVPGCRSGYDRHSKEKRHFFSPPKDHTMFWKWSKAIARQDLPLTDKSRICDLHFTAELILKYDSFMINGEKVAIPRQRCKLDPTAVPHIFPNRPKYLSRYITVRRSPSPRQSIKLDVPSTHDYSPRISSVCSTAGDKSKETGPNAFLHHVESFQKELDSTFMMEVKTEKETSPSELYEETGLEVKTEVDSDNYGSSGPLPEGLQPVLFCSVAGGPVSNSNGSTSMRQKGNGEQNLQESPCSVEEGSHHSVKTESILTEYSCSICSKVFPDSFTLEKHLDSQECVKTYSCKLCNGVFDDLSQLKEHNFNHNREKKYICSLCGMTFLFPSYLRNHMRSHNGQRPYSCLSCDKRFSKKSDMSRHMQLHTGDKPHLCNICGRAFSLAYYLRLHQRIHREDMKYVCVYCYKRYPRKGNLKRHLSTHSEKDPFSCRT